jgi:hypothetical protein
MVVSTHALLQAVVCATHANVQVPPPQTCAGKHVLPQPPQLRGSFPVSTHTPPHATCPLGHWQEPVLQKRPPVHTTPQPPQFESSLVVSTHC